MEVLNFRRTPCHVFERVERMFFKWPLAYPSAMAAYDFSKLGLSTVFVDMQLALFRKVQQTH